MTIKINNAAKIAKCGKFPRTFAAIIAAIPAEVVEALTAKKLASLADAMDAHFRAGREAGRQDVSEVPAATETETANNEKAQEMTKAPEAKPVAKKYALHNAFDVRDNIKDAGAKWDTGRKAWIVNQVMLDKFTARTHNYGMAWLKGWAKVRVEEIAG